jgi:hypothetical protein
MTPSKLAFTIAALILMPIDCLASDANESGVTRESCARELPPMQKKAKKLHEDVANAKAAYDKNPNPETEAAVLAAVIGEADFIGPVANMEYKCKELL